MRDLFTDATALRDFLLVTITLGGGAAALTGRTIAATWRPWWHVILFVLLLAAAVRFLHFALFGDPLFSLTGYAVDLAVCLICALAGFRLMRVSQMVISYGWINERSDLYSWRRRDAASGRAETPESG